jgi:hypothetical protein
MLANGPTAQRLENVQDVHKAAISLAGRARQAGNTEAERQPAGQDTTVLARDRRDGFDEAAFAELYGLCLQAMSKARRLGDFENICEKAILLAAHARQAGNIEAERQSEEIRALADRRIRQLLGEAETATGPIMLAPAVRNDVRGS